MVVYCHLGHSYEDSVHSECPTCKQHGGYDDGGKTVPVDSTVALAPEPKQPRGGETPTKPIAGGEAKTTTFRFEKNTEKMSGPGIADPVVGWLVCYEGMEKGKDYRIRFGQNSVGRDNNMDIVLKDGSVSRNSHCFITYDYKNNRFLVHSGMSSGVTYKNEELVAGATELVSFDKLEIGESKFVFIALCGENFKWEQKEKSQ